MYTSLRLARRATVVLPIALMLPTSALAATDVVQGESRTPNPTTSAAPAADGAAAGGSALKFTAGGTITFSSSLPLTSITVKARTTGASTPAYFNVTVDGTSVGIPVDVPASPNYHDYKLSLPNDTRATAAAHTVTVQFTGGTGRDLWVDQITVDDARAPLAWAAPSMTGAVTVVMPASGPPVAPLPSGVTVNGNQVVLNDSTNYTIQMPAQTRGSVWLKGGHNITLIGGKIETTGNNGLYIEPSSQTRTVHIEGLVVDGVNKTTYSDGLFLDDPKATFQVENTRVVNIRGIDQAGSHGDALQVPRATALRIDRFTAESYDQGLFLRPDTSPITSIDLRHVDVSILDDGSLYGGDAIWFVNPPGLANSGNNFQRLASSVSFSNTYARSLRADIGDGYVYPWTTTADQSTTYRGVFDSPTLPTLLTYPHITTAPTDGIPAATGNASGAISLGAPRYPYVKSNEAGVGYVTP